jgi:FMN phosphatase YigB (HAD superfamily)
MAPAIEAITFDFWNTLAGVPPQTMTEARHRAVAAACESCGVEIEAERLVATLADVSRDYEGAWSEGNHFHPRDGAEILIRALGIEGAAGEVVAEAFLSAGRGTELELAPDIEACLEVLSRRGIRLGIVCDVGFTGGELLRELLDDHELLDFFSGWAFSDEVGHYKPSPQIFEVALGALDAEPGRAMHVGDLRRTDIAGAAALGMRTVRYRGLNDDHAFDGPEGDFVLDSHRDLPALIDQIA